MQKTDIKLSEIHELYGIFLLLEGGTSEDYPNLKCYLVKELNLTEFKIPVIALSLYLSGHYTKERAKYRFEQLTIKHNFPIELDEPFKYYKE